MRLTLEMPSNDANDGFAFMRQIGVEGNLKAALREIVKDSEVVIPKAKSDEIVEAMNRQTEKAKSLGIFGSPSFIAGDELFWGDDRLEEALDW